MDTLKKVLKVIGIITAIAAAIVGVYYAVTKLIEKKNAKDAESIENYVSCSNFDADFISEETAA